jgi:hypothetical protein
LHAPRYDIFLGISLSSPWIPVHQQLGADPYSFFGNSQFINNNNKRSTRRRSGLGRTP